MSDRSPQELAAFNDRKKALIDARVSQAEIARQAQPPVSGALVHQVLLGDRKSARVFTALIAKLGRDVVANLWPDAQLPVVQANAL